MKKAISTFLCLATILLTSTPIYSQEAKPTTPFTGKITGNKVRMRLSPSLDGQIYKELTKDELVSVKKDEGDFYGVTPPEEVKAYVFRPFVLDGVVEGTNVNVRLSPDIEAPIIAQLNTGDTIEGEVSSENNKWLEIAVPADACFYIAKEYIQYVGDSNHLNKVKKHQQEAAIALNNAHLFSKSELSKPFEEINFELLQDKFNTIIDEYKDAPDEIIQAQKALEEVQDTYLQKKLAFLESQSEKKNKAPTTDIDKSETITKDIAPEDKVPTNTKETSNKMSVWEPIEQSVYSNWLQKNPNKTIEDFYTEESLYAKRLSGTLDIYSEIVKNKPGDYILKVDGKPIAYLYSTKVNLEDKIGDYIEVLAAPRNNNNFAFPAYYVLDIE